MKTSPSRLESRDARRHAPFTLRLLAFVVVAFVVVAFVVVAFAVGAIGARTAGAAAKNAAASAGEPEIHVETGTLDGVSYRIDMPKKWNGVLLVYYHGYSETPVLFAADQPNHIGTGFASAGYAVAQSGYSVTGWAVEQAIAETEALRRYTIAHYGQPKETYVMGHSMGGELTVATIERYPNRYDGALPLCGLLEPASLAIGRGGALLAAFHYYYPDVLPGPLAIDAATPLDEALVKKVLAALPSNPTGLAEMMALTRFKRQEDLADNVVFSTYIHRDLEQKLGAPVINNAEIIYAGGPDDNALNDGVKRYHAPTAALSYLNTWYTPTGLLLKPTLAVHTTYDPIIPANTVAWYADAVTRMASTDQFVQQYVKHDGHCNISGAETATALGELIRWKRSGVKPAPGLVPANGS
jgi:pimeloyl-ACP methyl ester carboxylesterase